MICKNCIHFKVCKHKSKSVYECEHFKEDNKNDMDESLFKDHICMWCHNRSGETDLQYSVIDDDMGQYVPEKRLKYCPFCGRNVRE